MKKVIYLVLSGILSVMLFAGCSNKKADTASKIITESVTKDNSKTLRLESANASKEADDKTIEDQIRNRLITAWGEWQPDYEGWIKWSNGLYTENATISAIGGKEQKFKDYQSSMKLQRDAFTMEMGPIMQIVVKDNVAALVYHMYMTPKNVENAPTFDMIVTEYNTVEKVEGKLMVTHLDLYTDGGGMHK